MPLSTWTRRESRAICSSKGSGNQLTNSGAHILGNCYLPDSEKREACQLTLKSRADYLKTSTGFGKSGATEADVRLMREVVMPEFGVKAAGGIRTIEGLKP